MSSPTDHGLMQSVRDGDVGKLALLFERHRGALFNFFLRLAGNRQTAEDLVQEVFFRMLKYRHAYRDDSRFTAWMYQIARHVRFDQMSKRRGEVPLEDKQEAQPSPYEGPGERLEKTQQEALLRGALGRLPADKRELLLLSRFQRLKYSEIAEILGCDEGAVKVRVYRAIRDLRDSFFALQGKRAS